MRDKQVNSGMPEVCCGGREKTQGRKNEGEGKGRGREN